MDALATRCDPSPRALIDGTPWAWIAGAGVALAAGQLVTGFDPRVDVMARVVAAAAAQGVLLATAVCWAAAPTSGAPGRGVGASFVVVLLGATGGALGPAGAVAYLVAPLWLWRQRAQLPGLGLRGVPRLLTALGALLGALLGAHLLLTASLTLRYGVHVTEARQLLAWLAYDAGANVLVTEAFFRGGLFDRAQRRWPFGGAAALTTGGSVLRYLADPLLPHTVELIAGAGFYLSLLGVASCWLYSRGGSIVPGMAASLVFFTAYRLLHLR